MGFSMTIAGGPTSSQPSLSPDISLQAVPLPQLTVSPDGGPTQQDLPQSAHPNELSVQEMPSPTESIPLSVSEIHFRHSSQSDVSLATEEPRRASRRLSARRTSHPPLPGTAEAQERPWASEVVVPPSRQTLLEPEVVSLPQAKEVEVQPGP